MGNILIIADSKIADRFIETIETKSLNIHKYTVVVKEKKEKIKDIGKSINYVELDSTSLFRLKDICRENDFNVVYIVVDDMKESLAIYENVRALNKNIRIVALDLDDAYKDIEDIYLNKVDAKTILANRLYDMLPNVPVTAQTIGLSEGEIMEVIVPFSSSYAFRHIGSIPQVKWKIAGIYRDDKLILPNNATMIRPRDRLLIIGKPQVLSSVFKKISRNQANFPEPFGRNFYLYLDIKEDEKEVIRYLEDALYLFDRFNDKKLIIRVVNPNNFEIVEKIKKYERDNILVLVSYSNFTSEDFASDLLEFEIGLIMISKNILTQKEFSKSLHDFKKLIYIFGENSIANVKKAVVIKTDSHILEEISSIVFYIAETLKLELSIREYDPEGNFSGSKNFIEHYKTLAHVHNAKLDIIQKKQNPIKAIKFEDNILLVIPFKKNMNFNGFLSFLKRDVNSLLLNINKHPRLLISVEE